MQVSAIRRHPRNIPRSYCDKPYGPAGNKKGRRSWFPDEWYNLNAKLDLAKDWVRSSIEQRQKDNSYQPGFGWVKGPNKCENKNVFGKSRGCSFCSIDCDKTNTIKEYGNVTVNWPDRNPNNTWCKKGKHEVLDVSEEDIKKIQQNYFDVQVTAKLSN